MRRRVLAGLAGVGRMGRIHAAGLATRCPAAERTEDGVHYPVKRESR
jgi:hypothetical protein